MPAENLKSKNTEFGACTSSFGTIPLGCLEIKKLACFGYKNCLISGQEKSKKVVINQDLVKGMQRKKLALPQDRKSPDLGKR